MYRGSSTPADRATQIKRRPIFLWLGSILALVAVLAGLDMMDKGRREYRGRNCPGVAVIPQAHTIVVIDQSRALSNEELRYVKAVIRREHRGLHEQDRLTVIGLRDSNDAIAYTTGTSLYFTTCGALPVDEVSTIGSNPAIVDGPLEELMGGRLNGLTSVPPGQWSPVMETIEGLSADPTFSSPFIARRLVLISGMVQNTQARSQHPRVAAGAPSKPSAARFVRAFLASVDVRVHYVFRGGLDATQTPDHEASWKNYFTVAGARSLQIGWGLPHDGTDQIAPISWSAVPMVAPLRALTKPLSPPVVPVPDGAVSLR